MCSPPLCLTAFTYEAKETFHGNRNTLNSFSYGTKPPRGGTRVLHSAGPLMTYSYPAGTMWGRKVPGVEVHIFLQMDLKRELKNYLTFIYSSVQLQLQHPSHCTLTHFYCRELLNTTKASNYQAAGGQGHCDGSRSGADWHFGYTNISVRQSCPGRRNTGWVKCHIEESGWLTLLTVHPWSQSYCVNEYIYLIN